MPDTPLKLGRYRLDSKLAEGGMAAVYRAYDEDLHRTVAIKVMRDVIREDPVFGERFVREARTIASFDHPNILTVFDFGASGETVYIVLPMVEGGSLKERLGKPIPLPGVVEWLRQVAAALDYAHARGVLHRDIKPANIMVNREGRLLLSDFGISRSTEAGAGLTHTGETLGTPNYMSPEQAIGQLLDGRSDQYSLAVMAYEMLTGSVPFKADTPLLVLEKHVRETPEPPSQRVPGLSAAVDEVFERVLAKDAASRYPTCSGFAEALARAAQMPTMPVSEEIVAPTVVLSAKTERDSSGSAATVRESRERSPWIPIAAILALVAVSLLLWWRLARSPARSASQAQGPAPEASRTAAAIEPLPPAKPAPIPKAVSPETVAAAATPNGLGSSAPKAASEPAPPKIGSRSSAPPASESRPAPPAPRTGASPPRSMARPLIRSAAAAALTPEIAEAYRSLTARGARGPSRDDFARARGLATEVAAGRPQDREAVFLRDFCAAAIDFSDGETSNAEALLKRALAAAPRGIVNEDAVSFAREALGAGRLAGRRDAAWELGLAFGDVRGDLEEQLDQALERDPGSARVRSARAVFYRDRGQTEKARREARAACEAAGGSYPIACELARELEGR